MKTPGVFTAPESGIYHLMSKMTRYKATDRWKLVDNDKKYWFQFWKPDLVPQQIYEVEEDWEGNEYKTLKQGETIETTEMKRIFP